MSGPRGKGEGPVHGSRSKGREIALKYLFAVDLRGRDHVEDFDSFVVHQNARGPAVDFARKLIEGTLAHWDRFDDLLASFARNWKLARMAAVDRNILRLGCFELSCHRETPAGVVINEAVELAKRFGSNESGKFVNGILDRVREQRDEGAPLLHDLTESPREP